MGIVWKRWRPVFKEMYGCGFVAKPELVACVVSVCGRFGCVKVGKMTHGVYVVDERFEKLVFLMTALDVNEVSWTTMIVGVTLISVSPACVELGTIGLEKDIHGYAFRHGLNSDMRLLSSLVHLYSKHEGSLYLAELIFETSIKKDVNEGVQPNYVTLLLLLTACTDIPSITLGSGIHGYVIKSGLDSDLSVTNSLINMYAKCGSHKDSHQVFREMSIRDCVSWSSLINAHGLQGCGEEALQLFNEVKEKGIQYDSITFLVVLSACNHAGLVEEVHKLFSEVAKDDNLLVNLEHYACYIDLLGRAGKLECASDVLRTMPMKPNSKIVSSLVSACKIHGRCCRNFVKLVYRLEPDNTANYTLLSMIYAEFGKWLNVEGVQRDEIKGVEKELRVQ
ncbi:Pentatricopeptide repeat-containing protein [Artemisia annua]|uniref:Pentatricopeptide repeat-containing protein n=1 Tax=Artemisia annua TaxID=35608 RepID=A0A2U1K9K9_ARTAN|nr:Pentatricopeptide repeat-containing protein [Artemisia annua]